MTISPPFFTNVTQKGQVTLPVDLREGIGISPRSKVIITMRDDEIVIRPVKDISHFYGKLKLKKALPKGYTLDNMRAYMETHYFDEK